MKRKRYKGRDGTIRPWSEVAKAWNARSGSRPISMQMVQRIGTLAERKLRKALGSFEQAMGKDAA